MANIGGGRGGGGPIGPKKGSRMVGPGGTVGRKRIEVTGKKKKGATGSKAGDKLCKKNDGGSGGEACKKKKWKHNEKSSKEESGKAFKKKKSRLAQEKRKKKRNVRPLWAKANFKRGKKIRSRQRGKKPQDRGRRETAVGKRGPGKGQKKSRSGPTSGKCPVRGDWPKAGEKSCKLKIGASGLRLRGSLCLVDTRGLKKITRNSEKPVKEKEGMMGSPPIPIN